MHAELNVLNDPYESNTVPNIQQKNHRQTSKINCYSFKNNCQTLLKNKNILFLVHLHMVFQLHILVTFLL